MLPKFGNLHEEHFGWVGDIRGPTGGHLPLVDISDRRRDQGVLVTEPYRRNWPEEPLRRNEAHLAEAQRLSRTGSFGCRVSLGEMVWSEETFRIFGYDRATEPTVEAMLQRVHPEDRAYVKENLCGATQEGKELDLRCRLLFPDETVKHLHIVARATNVEPSDVEIVGAVMDVTGQWRVATQLEKLIQENKLLRVRVHEENVALREEIDQACMF
ncbi:MAG TPA: PAS domain-containing protein, partial [Polyangia bacterium]|nr:PAS domain-containing protein [Polyangia bacterium]